MEVTASSTQLGCGRDIDDVWDNIDHPANAHELTCTYCQAARKDLLSLARATRDLNRDDQADPGLQTSPQVIDRIFAVARSEVRRGRRLPLRQSGPGRVSELTVSEQAVTAVIRRTGDRGGIVRIRRCTAEVLLADPADVAPADRSASDVAPADRSASDLPASDLPASDVRVSLRVSVDSAAPIAVAVNDLRTAIIDVVDREVGMNVVRVDVTVDDVHHA